MIVNSPQAARAARLIPSLFSLDYMIEEAIDFLREHVPPEGYFVGYSGGKDSEVILKLCELAGVRHQAFYSCTRIDPPELMRHIRQHRPKVTWLYPKMTFWEGVRKKSPPLRNMRWCCDVLKKNPSKHIPLKHCVMGMRAEESVKRAGRPRIDTHNGKTLYKPIFRWVEWHVWEFIERYNLPYCSLYDEGFSRLGCVICPFFLHKNQAKLNLHRQRWPQMYRVFEKTVADWFVEYRTAPRPQQQETPEEYLADYYRGFE